MLRDGNLDLVKYGNFLLEFDDSLLFQSPKYLKLLEDITGCELKFLYLEEDGILQAALPYFEKKGSYGLVLNTLPYYGSNGGVISRNVEAEEMLMNLYNQKVANSKYAASVYIENPLKPASIQPIHNQMDERIGQFTMLPQLKSDEDILTAFHYKTRNMVRKPYKLGYKWAVDNNAFDFLYKTHADNIKQIGGLSKSKTVFDKIQANFTAGVDFKIYVAYKDEVPCAAVLLFYYNKTIEYFTPVIHHEYRGDQPLSMLIFEAMKEGVNNGFENWNWGGTWKSQDGVYRFKSRFAAVDLNYKYYIKLNNEDVLSASKAQLLSEYNNFFVVPFNLLVNEF